MAITGKQTPRAIGRARTYTAEMRLLPLLLVSCGSPASTPPPQIAPAPMARPAAKPALLSYSIRDGQVVRLDLQHERIERIAGIPTLPDADDVSSLALIDDHLIACQREQDGERLLLVIDLQRKTVETKRRPCEALASDGTRIWVRRSLMEQQLVVYTGLGALLEDRVASEHPAPHPTSRLGTGGDRLFAAWHSADHVFAIDANGETRQLPLTGYDGWIFGIGETGGQIFVVGGWAEKGIRVFDIENGSQRRTLFASDRFNGLTMPVREVTQASR
jgi:hypothetical protein